MTLKNINRWVGERERKILGKEIERERKKNSIKNPYRKMFPPLGAAVCTVRFFTRGLWST